MPLHNNYPQPNLPPPNSHIVLGISGGVDSAVSALLLTEQGYRVTAVFMQNWEDDENDINCTIRQDYLDAQGVCQQLAIPLHTVNFAQEYWDKVFQVFLTEYACGRTPNPDILCNQYIKFASFIRYALKIGADCIATGHYAILSKTGKNISLHKASDSSKDQSYFLYAVNKEALTKSYFPLAHLHKKQVRAIAQQHQLINHAKKDSTGICFIGERKFSQFLAQYLPAQPGYIVTLAGEKIAKHQGLIFYTIGQRQGLGIGGRQNTAEAPWYVCHKNLATNELVVVQGHNHPALFSSSLIASNMQWLEDNLVFPLRCSAKIRYRQSDQQCLVTQVAKFKYKIDFDTNQRAVTLGQAVVLYSASLCLGGGTIISTEENK